MNRTGRPPARPFRHHVSRSVSRRSVRRGGPALATAAGTVDLTRRLAWLPQRATASGPAVEPSDIQFDVDRLIPPPMVIDGVPVRFGPIHTIFATAILAGTPTLRDQQVFADALATIERAYPYLPGGVMTHVAYGLPYFRRLPAGLLALHLPRLLTDTRRYALEEAVPSPTDVHPTNPAVRKLRFHVGVRIEDNDLLFTLRGDNPLYLTDVLDWLAGSDRLADRTCRSPRLDAPLTFTSTRAMFVQMSLPRKVAIDNQAPYASMMHPRSPMWMGFADQQTESSAPAPAITFRGAPGTRLTTAQSGDYFDNGAVQHLAHDILDLQQFYDVDDRGNPGDDAAFVERVQYVFRSTPPPSTGYPDQIRDGGGPAFLPTAFQGVDDAARGASGTGTRHGERRIGHVAALQRSSRTADGRPLHHRLDGPGFDAMDVPDGSRQPKLQFSIFLPTAELFTTMRRHQASLDLRERYDVDPHHNGLERFLTATRRQNFLIPPRRHRAFPLRELA
ncbi:MAG: hypothetical protein QOI74_2627 [Micromonosporaceae bacterium]|nr:hypothetical protein [Micromonosporaceae bacterium]